MKVRPRLIAIFLSLLLQACEQKRERPVVVYQPVSLPEKPAPPPIPDSVCIAAVGDIMLGTSFPDSSTLPPDSGKGSFSNADSLLRTADVTFGKLEGTLLDKGDPAHYKMHLKSTAYLFRMPTSYGLILKKAGFNLISIANNHIGDFGDTGRISTMRTLDSCKINYAGLLSHPTATFKKNGIKYGFCSFAPNSQTVPLLLLKQAAGIIDSLKKQCDIVIVSFHGGGEGAQNEHIPYKMESYYGEKRGNVYAFAHNAVDAGADLVFGNGPHVCRAMEIYKGRLVAYSLGNFYTYKSVNVKGVCGLSPMLKVNVNRKGEFLSGRLFSFTQTHDGGLLADNLNRAAARIKWLTQTDIRVPGLEISADGDITQK